jgi:hypothetical protein
MVYGLTTQTSAQPSDWVQVVVGPRNCTAPPLPPILVPGSPVVNGTSVALGFSGTYVGCAIDYIELEVGTSPGAADVGTYPLAGLNTFFPAVPPGSYYARARGVNQYGKSNRSSEMPLLIPGPCAPFSGPPKPINPAVTVNGSSVTIAWTLSAPTATFHQLALYDPANGPALDHLLVSSATSISAQNVPSGAYRVYVSAGNACGLRGADYPVDFTVP